MTIILPWPPSVNDYWGRNPHGHYYIKKRGKQYKVDVGAECLSKGMWPLRCDCTVWIEAHPPDNRVRDLDNILKAILDALKGYAYHDDHQIVDLRIVRLDNVKGGRIVVHISANNRQRET